MPCRARTAAGEPCAAPAREATGYCAFHDPSRAAELALGRSRGGRNARTPTRDVPVEAMPTVAAVRGLLEREIAVVLGREPSAQRSRTVGYLAGIVLRCLEVGEMESRLQRLEQRFSEVTRPRAG